MTKTKDIPEFGPLAGINVVSMGSGIAVPFAAKMMAEAGANAINIESAQIPDAIRTMKYWWAADRRNLRGMALDVNIPEGREVFLKLIESADIFLESSKGGTFERWSLGDDLLWEHNPRLVIVHVSGFGQTGVPEYVNRSSLDSVGQAFSGMMYLNGLPEPNPPMLSNPMVCDYETAMNTVWSALAALLRARQTGEGESVDVSQYESSLMLQGCYPMLYFNDGIQVPRSGNRHPQVAGIGVWRTKDGKYVSMMIAASAAIANAKPLLGLEGDPDFPEGMQRVVRGTPAAEKLEAALDAFCSSHTGVECQKAFQDARITAQLAYDYAMIAADPHYQAREDIIEWEDYQYGRVKGVGVFPKFKKRPGMVWRSAPLYGMDNEDILEELGYDEAQIHELYQKKVLNQKAKQPA